MHIIGCYNLLLCDFSLSGLLDAYLNPILPVYPNRLKEGIQRGIRCWREKKVQGMICPQPPTPRGIVWNSKKGIEIASTKETFYFSPSSQALVEMEI